MAMIAAGVGSTDRPDEHIAYMHAATGILLRTLYSVQPSISWYPVVFLILQLVSLTVIVRFLSAKFRSYAGFAVALVFLACCCLRPLQMLQFTTTAALTASAGALLILHWAESKNFPFSKCLITGLVLVGIGATIRDQSAQLVVLLTTLALFFRFLLQAKWKKLALAIVSTVMALATIAVLQSIHNYYYSLDGWREYSPLRDATTVIVNRHLPNPDERTKAACQAVGWSPADYRMLMTKYVLDQERFSVEKIAKAQELMPIINPDARSKLQSAIAEITNDWTTIPSLIIITILLLTKGTRRFPLKARLCFLLSVLAVCLYLICCLRFHPRVYASIFTCTALILAFYTSSRSLSWLPILAGTKALPSEDNSSNLVATLKATAAIGMILILLAATAKGVLSLRQRLAEICVRSTALKQAVKKLNPKPDELYVAWGPAFPFGVVKPFDDIRDYFPPNFKMMCPNLRNPIMEKRLRDWGITDLASQLDRPKVRLIISDETFNGMVPYIVQTYSKIPLLTRIFSEPVSNLQVSKAEYKSLSEYPGTDLSALCPRPRATDLVLFPTTPMKCNPFNLEVVPGEKNATMLRTTGERPTLTFEFKDPVTVGAQSAFFIEAAADPWMWYRHFLVRVITEDHVSTELLVRLLPDEKMHLYVQSLEIPSSKKVISLQICPLAPEPAVGSTVSVTRFGFLNVDSVPMSEASL